MVEMAMRLLQNGGSGLLQEVDGASEKIDRQFVDLRHSYTAKQRRDIAGRKYSFLDSKQLNQLYGAEGLYNLTQRGMEQFPFDPKSYVQMGEVGRQRSLRLAVRQLVDTARRRRRRRRRRRKRQLDLEPQSFTLNAIAQQPGVVTVFEHITLSPFIFSPTIGKGLLLGPVTLSPSLFSPYILSPSAMSPAIIAPDIADPVILSPYVLGPLILSPNMLDVQVR
jgi:hypothetical protein